MEICVFDNCDLEDTSLANKPKKFQKMFLFHYKIGRIKLAPNAKVVENQNFKCVYLRTMILCIQTYLKNGADMASGLCFKVSLAELL